MKSLLAGLASLALVIVPVSAQAGTRARDNSVSLVGTARLPAATEASLGLDGETGGKGCRKREDTSSGQSSTCEAIVWLAASAWLLAFLIRVNEIGKYSFDRIPGETDSSYGTGG